MTTARIISRGGDLDEDFKSALALKIESAATFSQIDASRPESRFISLGYMLDEDMPNCTAPIGKGEASTIPCDLDVEVEHQDRIYPRTMELVAVHDGGTAWNCEYKMT